MFTSVAEKTPKSMLYHAFSCLFRLFSEGGRIGLPLAGTSVAPLILSGRESKTGASASKLAPNGRKRQKVVPKCKRLAGMDLCRKQVSKRGSERWPGRARAIEIPNISTFASGSCAAV